MARIARIVAPGSPHYVAQEARDGDPLFHSNADRTQYLALLEEAAGIHKVAVTAWCLLDDSVHLLLVPKTEEGLGAMLRQAHSAYSRHVNASRSGSGTIWRDRYRSCPIDKSLAPQAALYIERLSVDRGRGRKPESYAWSSASIRAGKNKSALLSPYPGHEKIRGYAKFLSNAPDPAFVEELEAAANRGYAVGPKAFITRLEKKLGRPVRPAKG